MSASLNRVQLIGFLGRDPEVRTTNSGSPVADLSVATTYKSRGGEETTEWHKVVVFGQPAEFASEYLAKGSQVFIEGRLRTRSWEDKDGNKRYTTEIVAHSVQSLDRKGGGGGREERRDTRRESAPGPRPVPDRADEDDIPF